MPEPADDDGAPLNSLESLLKQAVRDRGVASASLNVWEAGKERFHHTCGLSRRIPPSQTTENQVYDLASLTKALVGSTVAACLVEAGQLDLDAPVQRWLTDVDSRVTPRQLLQHAAGWPAWAPLYDDLNAPWGSPTARREILYRARTTPLVYAPGQRSIYSDLGFLVLLELIEHIGGPLDAQFQDRVLAHVDTSDLHWGWPDAAATEDCPVRGEVVQGRVHDLNCDAMGGVSSHAGLFGTARGVRDLCAALLQADHSPTGLPGSVLRSLWTSRGPGSHVGGWDTITRGGYTSTGQWFPDDSIGHLGYTGTSVWMSPARQTVVVLLTNRVHPVDDKTGIRALRPEVHDGVASFLGWHSESPCAP